MAGAKSKIVGRKAQSDRLAAAMRRKAPGAFEKLIEFHADCARKAAILVRRCFPSASEEDTVQIALIGVIEAAKRYDERTGCWFTIYANYWTQTICHQLAPDHELLVRMPTNAFWRCYKLQNRFEELLGKYGKSEAERVFAKEHLHKRLQVDQWRAFIQWQETMTFSELPLETCNALCDTIDTSQNSPYEILAYKELKELSAEELERLPKRYKQVLKLRYGIGCKQQTCEWIEERWNLSRERVRQIQIEAEKKLAHRIDTR